MEDASTRWFRRVIATFIERLGIDSGVRRKRREQDPVAKTIAAALLRDDGVVTPIRVLDVPYQGDRYIVFGDLGIVRSDGSLVLYGIGVTPLLVRTQLASEGAFWVEQIEPRLKERGWLGRHERLGTEDVAAFFVGQAVGLGPDDAARPKTWAPACGRDEVHAPIGGDVGDPKMTTKDVVRKGEVYEWYDLDEVPVGGSVYRISFERTLYLFTKRAADLWEATVVPNASWPTTDRQNGSQDLGALFEGAITACLILDSEKDEEGADAT
jgi:hypothetical protein